MSGIDINPHQTAIIINEIIIAVSRDIPILSANKTITRQPANGTSQ